MRKLEELWNPISSREAEKIIGCSRQRIGQLIAMGKIIAAKCGGAWFIERSSAVAYKNSPRKPGRPKKSLITSR